MKCRTKNPPQVTNCNAGPAEKAKSFEPHGQRNSSADASDARRKPHQHSKKQPSRPSLARSLLLQL